MIYYLETLLKELRYEKSSKDIKNYHQVLLSLEQTIRILRNMEEKK